MRDTVEVEVVKTLMLLYKHTLKSEGTRVGDFERPLVDQCELVEVPMGSWIPRTW